MCKGKGKGGGKGERRKEKEKGKGERKKEKRKGKGERRKGKGQVKEKAKEKRERKRERERRKEKGERRKEKGKGKGKGKGEEGQFRYSKFFPLNHVIYSSLCAFFASQSDLRHLQSWLVYACACIWSRVKCFISVSFPGELCYLQLAVCILCLPKWIAPSTVHS